MKAHANKLVYISLAFIVASFLYAMYLLFYTPVYFTTQQPFRTLKDSYKIGDTLIYESIYCKHREYIPLSVERNLVDGYVYPLPNQSVDVKSLGVFPVGCRTVQVEVPLVVPTNVPVNKKYHIEITIVYRINALQTETRTFETEDFMLLEK